jgi:hypothetical protein
MILFVGLAALATALAFTKRARAQNTARLCVGPPSAQPSPPAGFVPFKGDVDAVAQEKARGALKNPLGHFEAFVDAAGRELGVLVSWHCHEESEGLRPIGWHKGANLFVRSA